MAVRGSHVLERTACYLKDAYTQKNESASKGGDCKQNVDCKSVVWFAIDAVSATAECVVLDFHNVPILIASLLET